MIGKTLYLFVALAAVNAQTALPASENHVGDMSPLPAYHKGDVASVLTADREEVRVKKDVFGNAPRAYGYGPAFGEAHAAPAYAHDYGVPPFDRFQGGPVQAFGDGAPFAHPFATSPYAHHGHVARVPAPVGPVGLLHAPFAGAGVGAGAVAGVGVGAFAPHQAYDNGFGLHYPY